MSIRFSELNPYSDHYEVLTAAGENVGNRILYGIKSYFQQSTHSDIHQATQDRLSWAITPRGSGKVISIIFSVYQPYYQPPENIKIVPDFFRENMTLEIQTYHCYWSHAPRKTAGWSHWQTEENYLTPRTTYCFLFNDQTGCSHSSPRYQLWHFHYGTTTSYQYGQAAEILANSATKVLRDDLGTVQ